MASQLPSTVWWRLPRAVKDAYLAEGRRRGLNERQVRYQVNTGHWRLGSEDRPVPTRRGEEIAPLPRGGDVPGTSLRNLVLQRVRYQFGARPKFSSQTQQWLIRRVASEEAISQASQQSPAGIEELVNHQLGTGGEPPPEDEEDRPWLWEDTSRRGWMNILWYH